MPFTFKLHDPPCDVAFLSIVDGEALYNADNARTRDVKEATIRQIGWHRVALPQDWFLSEKALETTTQVLKTMQCTVQYLKYRCKNEGKRNLKLSATLQRCEEERAAAFEELIELRETVALYKKKMREISRNSKKASPSSPSAEVVAVKRAEGLQCAFCENTYPSRNALESHFRKRHKRSAAYATMAAASAAVGQKQQQQQQADQDTAITPRGPSNLPFSAQGRQQLSAESTTAPSVVESRGDRSLREEVSELRLTIAKLLAQQAEFYNAMSPSSVAAVPLPSAATPTTDKPVGTRASSEAAAAAMGRTGALPGLMPRLHATDEEERRFLRLLQEALGREEHRGATETSAAVRSVQRKPAKNTWSSSPHHLTSLGATRPTLDPKSLLRASASYSSNSGVTGREARRGSIADSFIEVSPMSPSPSMAQRNKFQVTETDKTAVAATASAAGVEATALVHGGRGNLSDNASTPSTLLEAHKWTRKSRTQPVAPLPFSVHTTTSLSKLGSPRDDLATFSSDHPRIGTSHTPLAADDNEVSHTSLESAKVLAHSLDSDSPMVRLPSSMDAQSPRSSGSNSPSVNRYGPPLQQPEHEAVPQLPTPGSSVGGFPQGGAVGKTAVTATVVVSENRPASQVTPPSLSGPMWKQDLSSSMLSKKTSGHVPSVSVLQASSKTETLAPTNVRQPNTSLQPSRDGSRVHSAVHVGHGESVPRTEEASFPREGVRSPTQAPRHGSAPPTTRGVPVPALNLSTVSLHGSGEQPQRSSSPSVVRPTHRHSDTAEGPAASTSAADFVLQTSVHSPSGLLQSGFIPATQMPTQKAVPVVRLVQATVTDSAKLTPGPSKEDEGDDGSSECDGGSMSSRPSFLNLDVGAQPVSLSATVEQPQNAPPWEVREEALKTSDASYSIEALPYEGSEKEEEHNAVALNPSQHESNTTSKSSERLRDDIAVDKASSVGSLDVGLYPSGPEESDPVMEDVLTADLEPTPLFGTPSATYPAPVRLPESDIASKTQKQRHEEDDLDEDDLNGAEEMGVPVLHAADTKRRGPSNAVEGMSSGRSLEKAMKTVEQEETVSDDYSYYSYSFSDNEEIEESEAAAYKSESRAIARHKDDIEGSNLSLDTPNVLPPIVASPTGVSGRGEEHIGFAASAEVHAKKIQRKREKEEAVAVPRSQDSSRVLSGLSRVESSNRRGSDGVTSASQTHGSSFQSNVSHTVKKASGVLKKIFTKKKR